jgi:DNA-binding CsgD family transcriptional regulator
MSAEEETQSKYTHKKWEPKELNNRHREMMRRILEGASYVEIAAGMGLSVVTVSLICSSAIFKEELKKLEEALNLNVIRRAEDLSHEALDKLKVLMRQARSESLQASCAERVLGIAGYSKIEKKQVSVVSGEDVIRELNRRRREASQSFGRDVGPAAESNDSRSDSKSSIETFASNA